MTENRRSASSTPDLPLCSQRLVQLFYRPLTARPALGVTLAQGGQRLR